MKVELFYIDGCPNSAEVADRIAAVLLKMGHGDIELHRRLIETSADTAGTAFAGSPTVTVDGVDIFPGTPSSELACRVYQTPSGLAGMPMIDQIEAALKNHGLG